MLLFVHHKNFSSKSFISIFLKRFILYINISCLKARTVFLSNIDLLCFDDCHDLVVRNQYIGIMQYIMCKKIEYIPPVDSPPIIIGLTAEIGKVLFLL